MTEVLPRGTVLECCVEETIAPACALLVGIVVDIGYAPPPPADCTAVVESPARKKAGGFGFGAAITEDVKVAMVARSGSVGRYMLGMILKIDCWMVSFYQPPSQLPHI